MHYLSATDIISLLSRVLKAGLQIWPLRTAMIELITLVVCIPHRVLVFFAKLVAEVMQGIMFIEYSPRPRTFSF
jgi:hypothetical protein